MVKFQDDRSHRHLAYNIESYEIASDPVLGPSVPKMKICNKDLSILMRFGTRIRYFPREVSVEMVENKMNTVSLSR